MLSEYSGYFINCILGLALFFIACTGYAYLVNAGRPDDDPKKKDFHPAAIILAPITLPLFTLGWISLFAIRVLFYGLFLIVSLVGLVVFRKPFLFIWLDKIGTKVGNKLLEANMLLIRLFFPQFKGRA